MAPERSARPGVVVVELVQQRPEAGVVVEGFEVGIPARRYIFELREKIEEILDSGEPKK